jgi:hypothetical protein
VRFQVGRGVLSALGVGFDLGESDLAARVNFATKDESGKISDRRAGRIPSEKGEELVGLLNDKLDLDGVEVFVMHEKEYRAVAVFRGEGLSDALADSDPQRTGLEPLPVEPTDGSSEARNSAEIANSFVEQADEILADQHPANTVLVRGFGMHPALPSFDEAYDLDAAAIASYPMYKGLARLAGMQLLEEGEGITGEFETLGANWDDHDFFFVHIKPTDAAGEDGDFEESLRDRGGRRPDTGFDRTRPRRPGHHGRPRDACQDEEPLLARCAFPSRLAIHPPDRRQLRRAQLRRWLARRIPGRGNNGLPDGPCPQAQSLRGVTAFQLVSMSALQEVVPGRRRERWTRRPSTTVPRTQLTEVGMKKLKC